VSSAREISRRWEYDPAYQWLTGLEVINHHTLPDFRVRHEQALDELFLQVLGVLSHEEKMASESVREIYQQRPQIAEFPHAWIKEKFGLRQFRLRGLMKVRIEALWACLTYNICQWIRLCWRPKQAMRVGY
jgi:hypothetical protein